MRLLLGAWGPLPLSALAFSSIRTTSRRAVASAGAVTRVPAWIAGRSKGGAAPLRAFHNAGDSKVQTEVPLVQLIYDELRTIQDPVAEALKGEDSPVLSKVLRMMNELGPRDLGLSEKQITSTLTESLSVPISVAGRSSKTFEMAVFLLPAGALLPLHDHPNMVVLSTILFGNLEVESYDVLQGQDSGYSTSANDGRFGVRREALSAGRCTVDRETPSWMLTPSKGNVHAFRAARACAIFDVLLPPYDVSQGRPCTYFRVEDPPSLEPQGGEDSDGKGSKSTLARDSRGEEARSGLRAWSRGFGGGSACRDDGEKSGRRVILQEVPEPADLPHWCEYSGPTVVDKSVEAANSGC